MERKIIAHGIDISAHQGRVDWKKVANWRGVHGEKVDFAILRAGYGQGNAGRAEPYIHQHIEEAAAEGIDIGLYWFCYALNADEARQEARELIALANKHKGKITYPLVYDLEYDSDDYAKKQGCPLNSRIRTDMIKAFCGECEKAGYYSAFYTNDDYLINKLYQDELISRFDLWQSAPFSRGKLPGLEMAKNSTVYAFVRAEANIWQYYWWGEIPGINGVADLNLAFKDYPGIIRELNLNYLAGEKAEKEKEPGTHFYITLPCKSEEEAKMLMDMLKAAQIVTEAKP